MNKIITIFGFLLLICSCSNRQEVKENYSITGKISGFPDGTKFYLKNSIETISDSTILVDNNFKFEGIIQNPPESFYITTNVNKEFFYTFLRIGNEDVVIKGDKSDFPFNVKIEGSQIQDDYYSFDQRTAKYRIKRDSTYRTMFKVPEEKRKEIEANVWKEIALLDSITKTIEIEYIKSHPNSYESIIALDHYKNEMPKDIVEKLFTGFSPKIKNSKYADVLKIFLNEKIAEIGDKFHDFEGLNQNNKKVKFSNIRGQYTLLDFTSKNCGPCIKAAPELLEVNKIFGDSLKIISFSGDIKKEDVLYVIERDKIVWEYVWDGKGIYSETSIKYGVTAFPSFILINSDGIIIDKWIGYFGKGSLKARIEKNLTPTKQMHKK